MYDVSISQNAIASILASDQRLSEAWFGSIEAVLVRCGETLKAQAARLEKAKDTPDDDLDDGDDLDEFDEEVHPYTTLLRHCGTY